MRILFAGNKERGALCLKALVAKRHTIVGVLAHAATSHIQPKGGIVELAKELNVPVLQPADVNTPEVVAEMAKLKPELIVLAGYGPIVREGLLAIAPKGCINLHGGKLPQSRGSSPMNWALINGRNEFTLSIIQVDIGVDSGDILLDRTFPIQPSDSIKDLDKIANEEFPKMLVDVVNQIEKGSVNRRKQDALQSAYYPLRFPEDGFIVWDMYTAEQIHNRIRALTDPYPGAFTFYKRRKVRLPASRMTERPFYGEPGRIYQVKDTGLLIAASDRCLWIDRPVFDDTKEFVASAVTRYEKLPTLRDALMIAVGTAGKL